MKPIALTYLAIALLLNSTANVFLKIGAGKMEYKGLNLVELVTHNFMAILGIFLFSVNVIFYFLALRSVPISTAYPVMVIASFLIINLFAYFYFNENIHAMQVVGYFLIVAGLILVFYFTENVTA